MKRLLFAVLGLALTASAALALPVLQPFTWRTGGTIPYDSLAITMVGAVSPATDTTKGIDISKINPTAFLNPRTVGATQSAPDSALAMKLLIEVTGTNTTTDTLFVAMDESLDNAVWREFLSSQTVVATATNLFEMHLPFDARKKGGTNYGWHGQKWLRLRVHPGYVTTDLATEVKAKAFFFTAVGPDIITLKWRWPYQSKDSTTATFVGAGVLNVPDTTSWLNVSQINPLFLFPPDSVGAALVSPDSIPALKAFFEVTGTQNTNGDSVYVQWDVSYDGTKAYAATATWLGVVQAGSKLYQVNVPVSTLRFTNTNRGWFGAKYLRFRVRGDNSGKQLSVKPYVWLCNYRW